MAIALLSGQVGCHAVGGLEVGGSLLLLKQVGGQVGGLLVLMLKPAPANVSCATIHPRHRLLGASPNPPSATTTLFLRPRPMAIWARPNTSPPPALRIKVCVLPKAAFVETFTELSVTFVEITLITKTGASLAPAPGEDSPCGPFLAGSILPVEV